MIEEINNNNWLIKFKKNKDKWEFWIKNNFFIKSNKVLKCRVKILVKVKYKKL
jgi:hypothetical protein